MAEGIDGFAKGSVNFTFGKPIHELKAFERFVRLVADGGMFTSGARRQGTVGLAESECRRLDSTRPLLLRADRFQQG